MAISLFVLLMCGLAVDRLTSKFPPQKQTWIINPFTTDVPFRLSDEVKSDVAFTLCGDKQNDCAAFGHPV